MTTIRHGATIATAAGVVIAEQRHITPSHFTPVTEADLQRDFDDAFDAIPGRRWPEDWQGYRLDRIERDMAIIRRTRWETQR